jgi:hypothetical protein
MAAPLFTHRTLLLAAVQFAALACWSASSPADDRPPPAEVGFLGVWERAMPLIDSAAKRADVRVAFYNPDDLIGRPAIARELRLLFVLNLSPDRVGPLVKTLAGATKEAGGLAIVPLDRRDAHAELEQACR